MNWQNVRKYAFEFFSIFVAVIAAFALNNWNDNRRDRIVEYNILKEINNGLQKDLEDIQINQMGHDQGLTACNFWRRVLKNDSFSKDSLLQNYFNLTRDFIMIQNNSGYETLKSKGLEIIQDDSLRYAIISLYEYDYIALKKFEEEYTEMQFHQSFFHEFNNLLSPYFIFDEEGILYDIELPLNLSKEQENALLTYIWKIYINRSFIKDYYYKIEENLKQLRHQIGEKIEVNAT